MEYENRYSSNGKGNLGVTLGAIGTGLGILNGNGNGILGSILGNGNCGCSEDHCVNRYEASQNAKISELQTALALRDANTYVDTKLADVYERLNNKISVVEGQICQQNVYNATNTATINCLNNQIIQLQSLTKLVIPNTSVCPGWGNVTVTPTTPATGA